MKLTRKNLLSAFLVMLSTNAFAAQVEVTWTEPKEYRDIHEGQQHRGKFQRRTFENFEKHFAKLAESLPADQVLKINVTDVDLAGDVRFETSQEIRVVKDLYYPRMKFSYQLVASDNTVIKQDDVDIRDMNFLMRTTLAYRNKPLSYEKKMLDDWFDDTFKEQSK